VTCNLTPQDHSEHLGMAFRDGYDAGYKAGLAAPRGIQNPCRGSGRPPAADSVHGRNLGWAGRGACRTCGGDFKLTNAGTVYKHRGHCG
jgi:hypothetical protein